MLHPVNDSEAYLAEMAEAFATCAIWADLDDGSGDDLGCGEDAACILAEALDADSKAGVQRICAEYMVANRADLIELHNVGGNWADAEGVGHNLYLEIVGHGAGFRDRDLGDLGERLSAACPDHVGMGGPYVGDDLRVYFDLPAGVGR